MGLTTEQPKLEWHLNAKTKYTEEGQQVVESFWVARIRIKYDTNPERYKFRRFADVEFEGFAAHEGKPVSAVIDGVPGVSWFNTVEQAKIHVEALFALDY